MPNDDLFIRVLARIEKDPDGWDQNVWGWKDDCSTVYCFAGHTLAEAEASVVWQSIGDSGKSGRISLPAIPPNASPFVRGRAIVQRASELLGITPEQAEELFYLPTDVELVYEACARFLGLDPAVLRDKVLDSL